MIKLKIKEMWAARSRREKILLVLLTCVGLISGIRLYVFEPIFTWQRACQHMLFQAQQQLRWTEQQQAMLSMMSSAQKDKEEKKLQERLQNTLPDFLSIRQSTDAGEDKVRISMNEAELLPLIDWLSLLETKKNILVVKFVFDPEKEMYQAILQEEK